ncbi:MAG: phosphoribosylformylglycinamidine synthase subunit PurL [Candidatus Omnitrophica bacterium]|nr:phosphoribosylformylglycinamidine synthase subunit PurL [Candidatus Omnitrophota bacterium]
MITEEIYRGLGLSKEEYQKILKLLGREPTLTELAMFSVEWSEHCGYPRSRAYLKLLPRKGKFKPLVGEDAGGIILEDLAIVFKMESHNHPSYVEPRQGAATGVGGIIRDVFTTGARPVALLDSLRFGQLTKPYNQYLFRGVVDGIQSYGNCVGVPTVGGEIYFDPSYSRNCLVNVMCVGIAPKDKLMRAQAKGEGNLIIYAGASTGRDGIGGCSILASKEFKEDEEKRPTVQIGDPFTEKCLIEATLEAIATQGVVGIKDMGAAGLTCATSEMASAGDTGVEIDLDLVPRREEGMLAWEVMMSESQERMLLCVKKEKAREIIDIYRKWGLNCVIIGKVVKTKEVIVKEKGEIVAKLKAKDLTSAPLYNMPYQEPEYLKEINKLDINSLPLPEDFNQVMLKLLSSENLSSRNWVYEQYDYMVQTNTVLLPGLGSAVLRIKGKNKALALTTDCNSIYCYLDPFVGAQIAVSEACRNLVSVGAEPAGVTDCLNFGNPEKPDRFWYFKNCIEGLISACKFFNIPVVSGNVSFYNESPQTVIKPTPAIGMVGIIKDLKFIKTPFFKKEGDLIVLLGETLPELGGSEYLKEIHNQVRGKPPALDLNKELSLQKVVLAAIEKDLISSCVDCSEGGVSLALFEGCVTGREIKGAFIDNLEFNLREDFLLFSESTARVIISLPKNNLSEIEKIAKKYRLPLRVIGRVIKEPKLVILKDKFALIDLDLERAFRLWKKSLELLITA